MLTALTALAPSPAPLPRTTTRVAPGGSLFVLIPFGEHWAPAFAGAGCFKGLWRGVAVILLCVVCTAALAESSLTKATDLQTDGMLARKAGVPILILYSLPGCPHCEAIRRSHLTPMAAEMPPKAIIRQIDLQSVTKLRGFDGKLASHDDFVGTQGIKFAPVVVFYGGDGKRLGEPLVGSMLPDFYGAYLADGLAAATTAIRRGNAKAR